MPRPPKTAMESAAEFIAYYEQQLVRDPDSEEFGLGLEMSRWWQRLLQMEKPPLEEVSRLNLAMYAKRREMGGRWFDLSGRVEKWKRELAASGGFASPPASDSEAEVTDDPF